jgi:hypothetical protein
MTDAEIYQYLYSRKKERVKKVQGLKAGGWTLQFLSREMFMAGLKHKFIKKDKKIGWILIK